MALQGIEFWSNVCDEEMDLAIEASEAAEQGQPPENTSKFYAKGALQYLVPVLTQTLTKQDENDDDDDWNPSHQRQGCASCSWPPDVKMTLSHMSFPSSKNTSRTLTGSTGMQQ